MKKAILIICLLINISNAKDLILGVGLALPPYFIKDSNNGMELDIIREALLIKGHTIKTKYMPYKRIPLAIKNKSVDCVGTINPKSGVEAFYSNNHISYHNMAITLKEKNIEIKNINDLESGSIIAFQNAKKYLGKEYKDIVSKNPNYKEKANQAQQVQMLFSKRTNIVVSDVNIFNYFAKKDNFDLNLLQYNDIFTKVIHTVAFTDEDIRNDFNYGLSVIKKNGTYDKIIKSY